RYNFLTSTVTPFVAAGFSYGFGLGSTDVDIPNNDNAKYRIGASPFIQAAGGMDMTTRGGFTFIASVAYAALLPNNVRIEPSAAAVAPSARDVIHTITGSGIVASIAVGYAF